MYPVRGLIQVKGVPPELIGDLMEFVILRTGVVGGRFARLKGRMRGGGEDAVEPRLEIRVAWGGK